VCGCLAERIQAKHPSRKLTGSIKMQVGDLVKPSASETIGKWYGVVVETDSVRMPGLHGWQTMVSVIWQNGCNQSIHENNLEVISSCK